MGLLKWLAITTLNGMITVGMVLSGLLYLLVLLPAVLYLMAVEYREERVAEPPQRQVLY